MTTPARLLVPSGAPYDASAGAEIRPWFRVVLPLVQLALLGGLALVWSTDDTGRASAAGVVDRGFVALVLLTPVLLGLSAWAGWSTLRLSWHDRLRGPLLLAVPAQALTTLLFVPLAVAAPFVAVTAVMVEPIG